MIFKIGITASGLFSLMISANSLIEPNVSVQPFDP